MKNIIKIAVLFVISLTVITAFPKSGSAFEDKWIGTAYNGWPIYQTSWDFWDNPTKQEIADVTHLNYPYIDWVYNNFYHNGDDYSGSRVIYYFNKNGFSQHMSSGIYH
ncbi:hypothetical protein LSA88_002839 [Listeria monocytogenes]|nr:hypothetical protein [Listeria monocytogenes]EIP2458394.1 hypothetical protein [Listeria monocytogenes]EIP2514751.1 hypothetical protein [Listeria monocytogenes]EIR6790393.1 hypothetical protein [Listeria monocytogenes]EIR6803644.1 hypothetical protein [Listeria monocytogenes]